MTTRKVYIVFENKRHLGDGYWWYAAELESVWNAKYKAEERVKRLNGEEQPKKFFFETHDVRHHLNKTQV